MDAAERDDGAGDAGERLGHAQPGRLEVVAGGGRVGASRSSSFSRRIASAAASISMAALLRLLLLGDQPGAVGDPALLEREVLVSSASWTDDSRRASSDAVSASGSGTRVNATARTSTPYAASLSSIVDCRIASSFGPRSSAESAAIPRISVRTASWGVRGRTGRCRGS